MERDEYQLIQSLLLGQAAVIADVDLQGFIAAIDRAETVAPIVDPTAFAKGGARLEKIKRLAEAYRKVQAAYGELRELVEMEEAT